MCPRWSEAAQTELPEMIEKSCICCKALCSRSHELRLLKPAHLEPMLCNRRSNGDEKPEHCNEAEPPLATTRESLHSHEDPEQPDKQVNTNLF